MCVLPWVSNFEKSEARGSKEEMEAGCKREMMVAAGFHVLLTRSYSSVHLFFASGTPGKPQIPNSHGLNLGVGETVRNDEKRERRCRDEKSSGSTAFIRFRTVNGYSFEDTWWAALEGKNLSLVNFASETDFGRQGRREQICSVDVVAKSRYQRLTKVAS